MAKKDSTTIALRTEDHQTIYELTLSYYA